MVKMVNLRQTAADKRASKDADGQSLAYAGDPEGMRVHIEHAHAKKMGIDRPLKVGHGVVFHGRGEVIEHHADERGHRLTIRLHRAGMEADPEEAEGTKADLRQDLEQAAAEKGKR